MWNKMAARNRFAIDSPLPGGRPIKNKPRLGLWYLLPVSDQPGINGRRNLRAVPSPPKPQVLSAPRDAAKEELFSPQEGCLAKRRKRGMLGTGLQQIGGKPGWLRTVSAILQQFSKIESSYDLR